MRKWMMAVAASLVFLTSFSIIDVNAGTGAKWLDTSNLDRGVISVDYDIKAAVKTKLMVAKGTEKYTYNLSAGKREQFFPLQMGNGNYSISLLENTAGNKYKVVKKETVKLQLQDERVVFLNSIQNIAWTSSNAAVLKAKELVKNKKTDSEKAKAVYEYIVSNIQYDKQLAPRVPSDYLPSIDRTFKVKKDICYGYASLFAAMLRSIDIPAKLAMGTSSYVDVYHAWNEIYLDGKWVTVDTTLDAGLKKSKKEYGFYKESDKYKANKHY